MWQHIKDKIYRYPLLAIPLVALVSFGVLMALESVLRVTGLWQVLAARPWMVCTAGGLVAGVLIALMVQREKRRRARLAKEGEIKRSE